MKNHITSYYTESYVFLFDADAAAFGGDYGAPCSKMILDAVLALQQSVHARVYTGDMALAELCRRVFAVKKLLLKAGCRLV